MIIAAILACLGLLMIYFEFFLPGGIMGGFGFLMILSGVILFWIKSPRGVYTFLYFLGLLGLFFLLIRVALWRISNYKTKKVPTKEDEEQQQANKYKKS